MSTRILLLLASMMIFLFSNVSSAKEAQPEINQFVQTDGTTILFSQDVRHIGISGDLLSIELHKIFKTDGKNYNAIRIMTSGKIASKNDIASTTLVIDGINYELVPLVGARKDDLPADVEQIWYQCPDEILEKIRNAQKLSIRLIMNGGKKHEKEIGGIAFQSMKFLSSVTDINSAQNFTLEYGHPASFRMFFPGVKPGEIGPGLIYKANYAIDGKFNNYLNYYQANVNNDWNRLSLEYINSFYDNKNVAPFILVEMKEESNGTTVKVDVLGKEYVYSSRTAFGMTTTFLQAINYLPIQPNSKLKNGELSELDSWAWHLKSLYQDLHGYYDYGLDWKIVNDEKNTWKKMQKDWSLGPYDIEKVNKDKFKELSDVNVGDKIIAINGKSTEKINCPISIMDTKYSGNPTIFTIRHKDGVINDIKITPQFVPSTKQKTNYLELIKKNSGQLKYDSVPSSLDTVYTTYDPLGQRDF